MLGGGEGQSVDGWMGERDFEWKEFKFRRGKKTCGGQREMEGGGERG